MERNSSSCSANFQHEVFLSFRGEDIRENFLSHLYKALVDKGIITFKDDKELERGKSIEPSLLEAIQNSKIALVVFSPDYTSSSWCLDELVEIVRCREIRDQIILPIFFKINTSDILTQTGVVANAFEVHKLNFENDKIQAWRKALSTVAAISGWDAKSFHGSEADLIECIVKNISDRFICDGLCSEDELVGIDSHMKEMNNLLNFECNDALMVGIWGLGGIGKTTIANFIYQKHFDKFEACYRLKDIQRKNKQKGLIELQKELLFKISPEKSPNIWDVDSGSDLIRKRLQGKKVLIVLDDIDELEQLKALADITWFSQGSRIIITTRDEHLLALHEVKHIYKVPLLKDQALQLFSMHAFKKNQPSNDFLELAEKFVQYTHGLPLALKVLGAHLYGRNMVFWCSELEKLKRIPNIKVHQALRISYDGLDDDFVKAVFLDIAFFFNGKSEVSAKDILHQRDFYPESAFTILKEKALLMIQDDKLYMHEVIQGMGREIVREESKEDSSKRSRLWDPKDISDVLKNGKGTRGIQGISLDISKISSIYLEADTFKEMSHLRILKFYRSTYSSRQSIHFSESLDFLPNSLIYICWDFFPIKSLPSTFSGEHLVELKLWYSKIEHLWAKDVELVNLRQLDLTNSKCLKTLPNLSKATKIEKLILEDCEKFEGFSHDFRSLERLHCLNLKRNDHKGVAFGDSVPHQSL